MKIAAACIFVLFLSISNFAQSKSKFPKGWKIFSNNSFSFSAPTSLKNQDIRGIDSFVGEYKNNELIIRFDYGMYGNTAGNCNDPISVSVDRNPAKICFYKDEEIEDEAFNEDKPFVTAISFSKIGKSKQTKLTFWVLSKTEKLQKEAEKIVRSIKFK